MNKQELAAMVAEILGSMGEEPMVKGSDYRPTSPGPQPADAGYREGDFVPDVTELDLRKLYPGAKIIGHRDTSPDLNGNGIVEPCEFIKACPSFDAKTEYRRI